MTRRRMQLRPFVVIATILLLHIAADGFVFFQTPPRQTTALSATSHLHTQNQTDILSSYLFNLQKSRRHVQNAHNKQELLKPAKSLAFFLSKDYQMTSHEDPIFDRAVIQAIRLAASLNDYRLILQMVTELIDRAHETGGSLHPRILGEAVRGLTSTSASVGKIKTLWTLHSQSTCWKPSVGPLEVNAMLEAMCQRGKIKVAIDLYQQALLGDQTDSYSLSILFKGLASSIQDSSAGQINNASSFSSTNTTNTLTTPLVSSCWQWNEALKLFEAFFVPNEKALLGNPTIAALLEINQRANQVFGRDHDGAAKAILLFELLQSQRFPLDVITCTVILSQLQAEWKTALHILQMMNEMSHDNTSDATVWILPEPNARVYSAVMAVCARAGRYQETWKMLEEMKSDPRLDCELTTWMYNSVLQATAKDAGQSKARQRRERLKDMFDVFHQMEMGRKDSSRIAPDTVTYNTIFSGISICGTFMATDDWQHVELAGSALRGRGALDVVLQLLEKMERDQVTRDEKTYVHSLQAMAGSSDLRLGDLKNILNLSVNDLGHNPRVYNAAMAAALSFGDSRLETTSYFLSAMLEAGLPLEYDTITVLIDALCVGGKTQSVAFLFEALRGDKNAQSVLAENSGLSLCNSRSTTPDVALYTHAISQCLVADDFETARTILDQVKSHGLSLSDESLENVAQSYALSALSTMLRKTKKRSKRSSASLAARSRAENAFSVLSTVDKPALNSIALVSKACAGSGLADQAQKTLRQLHSQFLDSYSSRPASFLGSRHYSRSHQSDRKIVRDLHSSLMRHCARTSNIALALRLCEDIQYLAAQITWLESPQTSFDFPKTMSSLSESTQLMQETAPMSRHGLGMNLPEWKWLIQAAAKSGNWKVCLSTLHMLRPYVENNRISNYCNLKDDQSDTSQAKDYKILCSALGLTVSCLCEKHQPAWVIRSIDDWIMWSGQKPPHEAVTKAVRLLSTKGQHNAVASLLSKSISAGVEEDPSYEIKLVVGAISTLYKDGHYVAADDIFLLAVTNGWIPFDLKHQDVDDGALALDLHGLNLPMAHSAVRVAFQQGLLADNWSGDDTLVKDMVIVTGQGRNSALQMRPILRPAVQRMLVEEFYPPIGTASVPGNMGALRISAEDIRSWLHFQRQQKGARMIEVATALKKLSSGSVLREILRSAKASDQNVS